MRKWTEKASKLVGSFGFAAVLLLLLFLLTLLGTLNQVEHGLLKSQQQYFDSLWLIQRFDVFGLRFGVPLPGAMLVLILLAVNLIVGGLVRIRRTWSLTGIYITHIGILVMLGGSLLKFGWSDEGALQVWENEQSNRFESYHEWEIAISERLSNGKVREHLIPHDDIASVGPTDERRFTSDDLPFDLKMFGYLENSEPQRASGDAPQRAIDGVLLQPLPWDTEGAANIPGAYVELTEKGTGRRHLTILWGGERAPWNVEVKGQQWWIGLRRKRSILPFTIQLDKFTREFHPGTRSPRHFSSDVQVLAGGVMQPVRIQMNEPLRRDGFILFQSNWGPQNVRNPSRFYSVLEVVRNPADDLPLISCIIIAFGLLTHFSTKLYGYIRSQNMRLARQKARDIGVATVAPPQHRSLNAAS